MGSFQVLEIIWKAVSGLQDTDTYIAHYILDIINKTDNSEIVAITLKELTRNGKQFSTRYKIKALRISTTENKFITWYISINQWWLVPSAIFI